MLIQLSRPTRDIGPLVGHALQVRRELHCRNDAAEIGRDRLKPKQQIDAVLVDLLFELVDFLIVGNGDCTHVVIALE